MNPALQPRWLTLFTGLAGLSDTSTGLLLVFFPEWTFSLMRVQQMPPPVFGSYIGVFVLGVGLTYFYAGWQPLAAGSVVRWQTVWFFTALSRSLVAALVLWKCASGALDAAWLSVAATDATLATIQWIGLARGWLVNAVRK
jgi:hypothetical protein